MKLGIEIAACGLAATLGSGVARAERAGPLAVSYRGPPACPAGQVFVDLVHAGAPSVSLELSGPQQEPAAEVVVVLREADGSFTGSLQIRRDDGAAYFRELQASTCDELSTALAFVATLALTGQAEPSLEQREPRPAVPPPAPVLPAPRASAARAPAANEPPAASTAARWGFGGAFELGMRTGLAPTWSNLEQVSIEVRSRARRWRRTGARCGRRGCAWPCFTPNRSRASIALAARALPWTARRLSVARPLARPRGGGAVCRARPRRDRGRGHAVDRQWSGW